MTNRFIYQNIINKYTIRLWWILSNPNKRRKLASHSHRSLIQNEGNEMNQHQQRCPDS